MLGGVLLEDKNYKLNIDRILKVNNRSFYVSGNLIPETHQDESVIKSIGNILKSRNIGLVVDLSNYMRHVEKHNIINKIFDDYTIDYLKFDFKDNSDISQIGILLAAIIKIIPKIREYYSKSNKNILIHCYAGQNRSQFLFISYLMLIHNYDYKLIRFALMKNRNEYIMSNPLFIIILYYINENQQQFLNLINLKDQESQITNIINIANDMIKYFEIHKESILEAEKKLYIDFIMEIYGKKLITNINTINYLISSLKKLK